MVNIAADGVPPADAVAGGPVRPPPPAAELAADGAIGSEEEVRAALGIDLSRA